MSLLLTIWLLAAPAFAAEDAAAIRLANIAQHAIPAGMPLLPLSSPIHAVYY